MGSRSLFGRIAYAAKDTSFIIGATLVAILLVLAFIGPEIAPHDPYLIQRIQWIDGEPHQVRIVDYH